MLEENWDDDKAYFNDVQIDELKTKYNNKEILSNIWWYIFEYFQRINHILISIELTEVKIMREKLYWCQNEIIVIRFVCNYNSWYLKTAKIAKIVKWLSCMNITEARAFIKICVYYQIWIKDFTIIIQLIYILFKKNKAFIWKDSQIQADEMSREDWKDNLMQVK